jgi:biotin-(acetyl-CoA carboxylase) ligase
VHLSGVQRAAGIDDDGRLIVSTAHGRRALHAGEVHLLAPGGQRPAITG